MPQRIYPLVPCLLAFAASSCAPSQTHLVDSRNYREAMCKASQFSDDPRDAAMVKAALERDAAPTFHVHAVTRNELESAFGPRGAALGEQVLMLRIQSDVNGVDAGEYEVEVSLVASESAIEPVKGGRESLAALTGERLPQSHVEVHGPGVSDKLAAAAQKPGAALAGLGEALTLGVIPVMEMAGYVPASSSTTSYPTDEDYQRESPLAEAMVQAKVEVWRRPVPPGARLRIHWGFRTSSYRGACEVKSAFDVALRPGDTLESRINATFGNRLRSIEELRR